MTGMETSEVPVPLDYVSDPALEAFFAAREHEAYYLSLKSVDERRGFHDRLIVALEQVLELVDERTEPFIDEILARSFRAQPWLNPVDPVEEVRVEEPEGIRLLDLAGLIDFGVLKAAYRVAVRKFHPDRGGSNADMVALNRAYELLHARLGEQTLMTGTDYVSQESGTPLTTADYLWLGRRLLFDIALDDWALDEASGWLDELVSPYLAAEGGDQHAALPPPDLAEIDSSERALRRKDHRHRESRPDDDRLIGLVESAAKLAERLTACGAPGAADRALAIGGIGLSRAQARGLYYDFYMQKAQQVVEGKRKPRFILNHTRQLDNALRLGAIDRKRFEANLQRVTDRSNTQKLNRLSREELLSSSRFVEKLPIDVSLSPEPGKEALVPHPGWSYRAEELTAQQQAEYVEAFGPAPRLPLVEKYARVRLSSLLRSAIFFLERVEVASLASEATLLAELQPGCEWHAEQSGKLLRTLGELEPTAARELADQLRLLLEPPPPDWQQRGRHVWVVSQAPSLKETSPRFFEEADELCARLKEKLGTKRAGSPLTFSSSRPRHE